jgi:hypothetical protein
MFSLFIYFLIYGEDQILLHELYAHNECPLRPAKCALHIGIRRSHSGCAHRIFP